MRRRESRGRRTYRRRRRVSPIKARLSPVLSQLEKMSRDLKNIQRALIKADQSAPGLFADSSDEMYDGFLGAMEEVGNFARQMRTLIEYLDDAILEGKDLE